MKLNLMFVLSLALFASCSKPKLNDMQSFTASQMKQNIKKACYRNIKDAELASKNCGCAMEAYDNSIKEGNSAYKIVTSNIPADRADYGKELVLEIKDKCNFVMN